MKKNGTGGGIPSGKAGAMVERLCALLADGKWHRRAELITHGFTEREVRSCRNLSAGKIMCGQEGYKLAELATNGELQESAEMLRRMAEEVTAQRRFLLRLIGERTEQMELITNNGGNLL